MKAKKLKLFRISQEETQEQMAKNLNITKQQLSKIETGKSNPSTTVLRNFKKHYKYKGDILELFELE